MHAIEFYINSILSKDIINEFCKTKSDIKRFSPLSITSFLCIIRRLQKVCAKLHLKNADLLCAKYPGVSITVIFET